MSILICVILIPKKYSTQGVLCAILIFCIKMLFENSYIINNSTNFAVQCSNMSVVRFKKIFSTFVIAEQLAHTYWKVFSHVLK